MVISFQSKQPLFSRSLGQSKKWHQIIKCLCNKDGKFSCNRYRYFFGLYKQTMLIISCIIPEGNGPKSIASRSCVIDASMIRIEIFCSG